MQYVEIFTTFVDLIKPKNIMLKNGEILCAEFTQSLRKKKVEKSQ